MSQRLQRPLIRQSIIVRHQFISAPQLAHRIKLNKKTCDGDGKYLDCCTEYYSIQEACYEFSKALQDERLQTAEGFLQQYEASERKISES